MSSGENHSHLVGKWVVRGTTESRSSRNILIIYGKIDRIMNNNIEYRNNQAMFHFKSIDGMTVTCTQGLEKAFIFDTEEEAKREAETLKTLYE